MGTNETYKNAFQRYERARLRYSELQQEIREFLARFTGDPSIAEDPFILKDLARMVGLRMQRDEVYETFHNTEQEIFDRLGGPWD